MFFGFSESLIKIGPLEFELNPPFRLRKDVFCLPPIAQHLFTKGFLNKSLTCAPPRKNWVSAGSGSISRKWKFSWRNRSVRLSDMFHWWFPESLVKIGPLEFELNPPLSTHRFSMHFGRGRRSGQNDLLQWSLELQRTSIYLSLNENVRRELFCLSWKSPK